MTILSSNPQSTVVQLFQRSPRTPMDLTGVGADAAGRVLLAQVKAAVLGDPQLRGAGVQICVYGARVQLCGFVAHASDIERAGALATNVRGVERVFNDLHLR